MKEINTIKLSPLMGRIKWIDSSRGIAILLVVLGHCIGYDDNPLNKLILSFHMPVFFFLSGICMNIGYSVRSFIKRRFKRMLGWQLVLTIICTVYDFVQSHNLNLLNNLFIWFLPVLFCSEITFLLFSKVLKIDFKVCMLLVVISYISQRLHLRTIIHIEIVPTAVLFLVLGYVSKYYLLNDFFMKRFGKYIFVFIPVVVFFAEKNRAVMMYNNEYGNFVFFMLTAMGGCLIICVLGRVCEKNGVLQFFGKNSILVYVLHFRMTSVLHFIFSKISSISYDLYCYPFYWGFFGAELVVLWFSIVAYERLWKKRC